MVTDVLVFAAHDTMTSQVQQLKITEGTTQQKIGLFNFTKTNISKLSKFKSNRMSLCLLVPKDLSNRWSDTVLFYYEVPGKVYIYFRGGYLFFLLLCKFFLHKITCILYI